MASRVADVIASADALKDVLSHSGRNEFLAMEKATARFEAALARSDQLADDDESAGAKRKRDSTATEEARLNEARQRHVAVLAQLTVVSVA